MQIPRKSCVAEREDGPGRGILCQWYGLESRASRLHMQLSRSACVERADVSTAGGVVVRGWTVRAGKRSFWIDAYTRDLSAIL